MDPITMQNYVEGLMRREKEEVIGTNRDLLQNYLNTIPVGNRIQNIPNLATLRTMNELEEIRTFVENVYGGGPLWPAGTLGGWRILPAGPAPVLALTEEQRVKSS